MMIPCQSLHAIYIKHFPLQPQHEPLWTAAIGVLRRFSGIHQEFPFSSNKIYWLFNGLRITSYR